MQFLKSYIHNIKGKSLRNSIYGIHTRAIKVSTVYIEPPTVILPGAPKHHNELHFAVNEKIKSNSQGHQYKLIIHKQ